MWSSIEAFLFQIFVDERRAPNALFQWAISLPELNILIHLFTTPSPITINPQTSQISYGRPCLKFKNLSTDHILERAGWSINLSMLSDVYWSWTQTQTNSMTRLLHCWAQGSKYICAVDVCRRSCTYFLDKTRIYD